MKKIWNSTIKNLPIAIKETFTGFFSEFSNSTLFWNGLIYLIFIIIACINIEAAGIISAFGSLMYFAACLDGAENEYVLWSPLTFLFWIFVLLMLFIYVCEFIAMHTIIPFNKWLDGLKKDK